MGAPVWQWVLFSAVCAGLGPALSASSAAHSSCTEEDLPDGTGAIPAEHLGIAGADGEGRVVLQSELTLVPVEIDPLGAPPDVAWIVFASALNVRTEPSTRGGSATVVGSLPRGTRISGSYYIVAESDEEWLEIGYEGETRYISRTGVTRPHPTNLGNIAAFADLPIAREIVNRWWAVPIAYEPSDLAEVPLDYTNNVEGREYLLRLAARDAVVAMIDAARADGVDFRVASPYRSGERQTAIYQNAVSNNLAQRSSAPPGHSEHQLGTTTDFSLAPSGRFLNNSDPAYLWLAANGARFGFVQTYTADNIAQTGYIEEPWHWRYFGAFQIEVTGEPSGGGNILGGGIHAGGAVVEIEAVPGEGFLFSHWSGDASGNENPLQVELFEDLSIVAHFLDPIEVARQEGIQEVLDDPAAFGLFTEEEWEANRLAGQEDVVADPGAFGLFTENSIQDLRFGGLILRPVEGGVELEFSLEGSEDLQAWEVLEQLVRTIDLGPEKGFLRLRAAPAAGQP